MVLRPEMEIIKKERHVGTIFETNTPDLIELFELIIYWLKHL
jgi:hypothetical protein